MSTALQCIAMGCSKMPDGRVAVLEAPTIRMSSGSDFSSATLQTNLPLLPTGIVRELEPPNCTEPTASSSSNQSLMLSLSFFRLSALYAKGVCYSHSTSIFTQLG